MIVHGMLVCSSFLCVYVYCVKSLSHIEYYSDCSRTGAIWLYSFATVLFNVCSAATVEYCILYMCCVGVFAAM